MPPFSLRPRLRRRRPSGALAALSAGGLAAGAALYWFAEPRRGAEHRRQAADALRGARARATGRARDLAERATEASRGAAAKVDQGAQDLGEHARGAADQARAMAEEGRAALERRGWAEPRVVTGAAGGLLLARALLGGGLLRIPFGVLGASFLARSLGLGPRIKQGARRVRDAAGPARERLQRVGRPADSGGGHDGGGRAQVTEVKSPAELESAGMAARGGAGAEPGATLGAQPGEDGGFIAGDEAPMVGSYRVEEEALGVTLPREEPGEDEGAGRYATRREPGPESGG